MNEHPKVHYANLTTQSIVMLHDLLLSLTEDNLESVKLKILASIFIHSEVALGYLWEAIFITLEVRPAIISLLATLIVKIYSSPHEMNSLSYFKSSFLKLIQSRKDQVSSTLNFYYQLWKHGFLSIDDLMAILRIGIQCGDRNLEIYSWFAPEIEQGDVILAQKLENDFGSNPEIEILKPNAWELLKMRRDQQSNHHLIAIILKDDDSDALQEFAKSHPDFNPNDSVPNSPYEPIDFLFEPCTYLCYAAFHGAVKCFRLLLMLGANVLLNETEGMGPMHFAIANGQKEIISILETYPVSYSGTAHIAALYHQNCILQWLINEKCQTLTEIFQDEGTVFHAAMRFGNIEAARFCLSSGMSINVRQHERMTPLHFAAEESELASIQYLASLPGSNIDATDIFGQTALHYAANRGVLGIVSYLIKEAGSDSNMQDNDGRTPLHYAVHKKHIEVVDFLTKFENIDVNKRDRNGETALHVACKMGNPEIVKMILKVPNVQKDIEDKKKRKPVDVIPEEMKGNILSLFA